MCILKLVAWFLCKAHVPFWYCPYLVVDLLQALWELPARYFNSLHSTHPFLIFLMSICWFVVSCIGVETLALFRSPSLVSVHHRHAVSICGLNVGYIILGVKCLLLHTLECGWPYEGCLVLAKREKFQEWLLSERCSPGYLLVLYGYSQCPTTNGHCVPPLLGSCAFCIILPWGSAHLYVTWTDWSECPIYYMTNIFS